VAVRAWSVRSSGDDADLTDRRAPVGHGHLLGGATRKRARKSNHGVAPQRESLGEVLADAQRWAATITPAEVLSQIGNPPAANPRPVVSEELDHAA
jgi:hypothetical protein